MTKNNLLFIVLLFLVICSCKTSKKNTETKSKEATTTTVSANAENNNNSLLVSFFSIGSGIDYKIKDKYDSFIKQFEQQRGIKLSNEISHLGKEGETDYCFNLSELNSKDKEQFVNDSKNILKQSSLVRIEENTNCKNKKK